MKLFRELPVRKKILVGFSIRRHRETLPTANKKSNIISSMVNGSKKIFIFTSHVCTHKYWFFLRSHLKATNITQSGITIIKFWARFAKSSENIKKSQISCPFIRCRWPKMYKPRHSMQRSRKAASCNHSLFWLRLFKIVIKLFYCRVLIIRPRNLSIRNTLAQIFEYFICWV